MGKHEHDSSLRHGITVRPQGPACCRGARSRRSDYHRGFGPRGRLQAGAFADIKLFDPDTVEGMAGYEAGTNSLASECFPHVIVNGQPVIRDGTLVPDVHPGQEIRAGR